MFACFLLNNEVGSLDCTFRASLKENVYISGLTDDIDTNVKREIERERSREETVYNTVGRAEDYKIGMPVLGLAVTPACPR